MIDTLFALVGAALMLYAAVALWQKAQQQPMIAPIDTHTRSGYIPPVAPAQPPAVAYAADENSDDDGTISPETLAAWAAADATAETLPEVIRPSWGTTLYEALGVAQDATAEQIRSAYREQCAVWHPDKNSDPDAANEFSVVANAYKVLTTQRQQYDAGLGIEEMFS